MMGLEEIKKANEDHAAYLWSRMTAAEKRAHPSLNPNKKPFERRGD